jgi:hypothetical protein
MRNWKEFGGKWSWRNWCTVLARRDWEGPQNTIVKVLWEWIKTDKCMFCERILQSIFMCRLRKGQENFIIGAVIFQNKRDQLKFLMGFEISYLYWKPLAISPCMCLVLKFTCRWQRKWYSYKQVFKAVYRWQKEPYHITEHVFQVIRQMAQESIWK